MLLKKMAFGFHSSYRSKPDESELDMTDHFVDLDSSFKRMLDEKRQMTNKENSPPAAVDAVVTTINPPEKPLRKDLLKEREYKCIIQLHLSKCACSYSMSFIGYKLHTIEIQKFQLIFFI